MSFEGRISRKAFWLFTLAVIVLYVIAMGVMFSGTDMASGVAPSIPIWYWIMVLVLLWPSLAVQAKRWHDQDKSAWWILIGLVPFVGGLIVLIMCGFIAGSPGPNRFGAGPMA